MIAGLALAWALQGQGRSAIGIYEAWGAFRDSAPRRCFAISQPVDKARRGQAFVSIADWPGSGWRGQLHVRLSRARAADARVTLSIGERRFELQAGALDAWAPDARTDAAVISAMRDGRSLSVETVAATGRAFVDAYTLKGAASAIDAATLACLGSWSVFPLSESAPAF